MLEQFMPIALLICVALAFGLGTIIMSGLIGRRSHGGAKDAPYECGIPGKGTARIRYSVKFYMVALLFLLFDMETMFIIVWALVYKDPALQVFSLIEMGTFVAILLVGYAWAWKKGALQWVE
ncbi:MAG: NADH-quinone oxidoreductase subunit A [Candidatus Sumerlaeia bacterium]